jgi:hypothetical protein
LFDPLILDRLLPDVFTLFQGTLAKEQAKPERPPFVAGFRMLPDMASHDLHQFFSLKRLWSASK